MSVRPSPASLPAQPEISASPRERIVAQARYQMFNHGYAALTMDDLARELGMSKKTLYVHFPSKHAIARQVIDGFATEFRADADLLLSDARLTFAEKLRGIAQGMSERLGRLAPNALRDLERFAPDLHRHVEKVRSEAIPYVFGRLIEEGQISGAVRDDLSPVFSTEFYLQAIQGLMHPETQQRLKLTPAATFDQAIRIFFGGLLTPTGQKEYDHLFPR